MTRHRHTNGMRGRLLALLATFAMLATACGGGGGEEPQQGGAPAATGPAPASEVNLEGTMVRVGSKAFQEQLIMGEMAKLALEDAGAQVGEVTVITGGTGARQAFDAGQIDVYPEYTGTTWSATLGRTEIIPDEMDLYNRVVQEDGQANGVRWGQPSGFNNRYAIGASNEVAQQLGTTTMTDYARLVNEGSPDATLCAETDFVARPDGLPLFEGAYAADVPDNTIVQGDLGVVYNEVDSGERCKFAELYTTDGRNEALGLTVLEDDQDAYLDYNASYIMKQAFADANPAVPQVLDPIMAALTNDEMTRLNGQVDVEGEEPEDVARTFLEERGFIGG